MHSRDIGAEPPGINSRLSALEKMPDDYDRIRIAVIGAGRIGKLHAEHLATRIPGAQLAAVADINLAAAQETASRFNAPVAVADYRQLLDDKTIHAVIIASATDTHTQITQQAAARLRSGWPPPGGDGFGGRGRIGRIARFGWRRLRYKIEHRVSTRYAVSF